MNCAESLNENSNINPNGIIILGVNIHCEGCANEVLKHLHGFQGVEVVDIDAKNHKVTIKGENADPIKVRERLRKKSRKHVELISPNPQNQQHKKEENLEVEMIEVVLKIYLHCEGCAKEVRHCILKMEGVQSVDPDVGKNTVNVKGIMDTKKLVEFINKRGGRYSEIVNQTKIDKSAQINSNQNTNCLHNHPLVFAPHFFSDENPNSCSLM